MTAPTNAWRPWWDRATEYQAFDMRDEFMQGLTNQGYRPSSRSDAIYALYTAGFVRSKFSVPKSHTGKADGKPSQGA